MRLPPPLTSDDNAVNVDPEFACGRDDDEDVVVAFDINRRVGKCSDERRAAAAAGWCGLPFPDLDDVVFFVADL
jgi:hypothetical protein